MLPHDYRVQVATSADHLRAAYTLRIQVFGDEFGYGCENEIDQCVDHTNVQSRYHRRAADSRTHER